MQTEDEGQDLFRLAEVSGKSPGARPWRAEWENVETRSRIARRLTEEEHEAFRERSDPSEKPLWSREEIEAIGVPDDEGPDDEGPLPLT